jgi:hypothetical protein
MHSICWSIGHLQPSAYARYSHTGDRGLLAGNQDLISAAFCPLCSFAAMMGKRKNKVAKNVWLSSNQGTIETPDPLGMDAPSGVR